LSLPERYDQIGKDIKTILSGEYLEVEIENIRKDGSVRVLELKERTITLKSGKPGILAIVNDITSRIQSQEAETSLREQIKIILDLVPNYIFAKDYDGKFIMVNKSLANLFGVSPEEVGGKTDVDYGASEEQIKGYLTTDRAVIDSGKEIFIKEEQVLRKDGSLGWFQTHKIPYNHPGIKKPAILGVAVDITERKRAEEVLQESESRYRELIDLAVDGILLGSHDGVIIDANKSMCDILGMNKDSFIGKHITYLPFKNESVEINPFRFDLLNKGEIVLTERILIRPDGKEIIVEMRSKMMPDGSYQSFYRNITNRKLEEQEIKSKNDELIKINNEKDKFFSIIAHDLRNPFQGFLGYTNLLRTNINSLTLNELKNIATDLNINAHTLFELLTNLLEWSMMQRGLTAFNPEKLSIKNLADDILNLFKETAKQKGIEIKEEIREDIFLMADKSMLSNVFRNLVSNSIKFTKKNGLVTIYASKSENVVIISVKDSGIGMNKKILDNLFKIDIQTNRNGTADEPSTGLGLLLCKEYVEKHKGKIIVKSEEGRGSEFIVSLPVV
jgi:PAS domain S-box-containing protein